jgi:hypothetical protein
MGRISAPPAEYRVRVTMSLDDGPPEPVEFSHPPLRTSVRDLFAAMRQALVADRAETVHFHAGEEQPEVCFDPHCTSPRLDVG